MSKYSASIWELLKDKRVKIVFDSFEKARVHLEGKTIGIDAINQTVTEPGASWAVMRREFGKRVLALTLCGAKLVAFIDGEFASPGAGKTKKAGERAMAAGETLPPNTAWIRAAAAFPRGILDAATVEEAYQWASDQFGGGLLPPVGHPDYENILEKFRYVREYYSES